MYKVHYVIKVAFDKKASAVVEAIVNHFETITNFDRPYELITTTRGSDTEVEINVYGETKAKEIAGKMKRQLDSYVLSVSTSLSNLDGVNGCSVTGETTTTFQTFKVKFGRI